MTTVLEHRLRDRETTPPAAPRFPRRTLGVYRQELDHMDEGWNYRDEVVVDLSEPCRRYDAGWIL
jgi:hypothetical protein